MVKFHVVNAISTDNAIIGWTTLAALKAITSIPHLKMKFPTEFGIGEIYGDQQASRQCYLGNAVPKKNSQKESSVNQVIEVDPHEIIEVPKNNSCETLEEVEDVIIDPIFPNRIVKIGSELKGSIRENVIKTLRDHADHFAWDPNDIRGNPENVSLHRLNIKPDALPLK